MRVDLPEKTMTFGISELTLAPLRAHLCADASIPGTALSPSSRERQWHVLLHSFLCRVWLVGGRRKLTNLALYCYWLCTDKRYGY